MTNDNNGIESTNHSGLQQDMCRRVINNITVRVEVARSNGGHIEHLIHRG
jgi:hypothetical protein